MYRFPLIQVLSPVNHRTFLIWEEISRVEYLHGTVFDMERYKMDSQEIVISVLISIIPLFLTITNLRNLFLDKKIAPRAIEILIFIYGRAASSPAPSDYLH